MGKSWIAPLIIGVLGAAVLIALGIWQVQRLNWKQDIIAQIDARMTDAPAALPAVPNAQAHRFKPVEMNGQADTQELHVLVSHKQMGAGFKVITGFQDTSGRKVLLDQGFVRAADKDRARLRLRGQVVGNLHWPDDRNASTPENDQAGNMWFARDLQSMAEVLGTEPVLVVLRSATQMDPSITPLPLDSAAIANNHLNYAITWFSLAAVWLGMTAFWLWRIRRRTI